LVNLKPKRAGDGYPKKAIEKTVLRFLGSRTFSHGLDPEETFNGTLIDHEVGNVEDAQRIVTTNASSFVWLRGPTGFPHKRERRGDARHPS
jgi:hypothetical protein